MDASDFKSSNADETISSLSRRCISGFMLCIESSHAGDLDSIDDARGRFNVWAANLGALQPPQSLKSLESRLKDAELMRNSVISGLERLERVQIRVTSILAGQRPNRKSTGEMVLRVKETHPEVEEPVMDELHELLLNMKTCVDHLFGLSMLIRRLKPKGRFHQLSSFQPSDNFHRDVVTVLDKFPNTRRTPWLADRLGRAIDQRRQFFAYRQQHRAHLGNISKGKQVLSASDNATVGAPTTVATTFEEKGDDHPLEPQDVQLDRRTVVTAATSFVSDFDESAQMGRHIPDLPELTLDGVKLDYDKLIECPYCRTIQAFANRLTWKQHVFSDLQPYVCTFENCSSAPFSTRNEWFQHELDCHRRRWECILCGDPRPEFSQKAQVEKHFDARHKHVVTENQIGVIIGACETSPTKLDASACPLCSEWKPPLEVAINLREFRRHLARHLQQISLEALPLYIEGLVVEEDRTQDDTIECKKGILLFDSDQAMHTGGISFAEGDEVFILDNMFDKSMWHVLVMKNGSEGRVPAEWVKITGAAAMSLSKTKPDPSRLRRWMTRSGSFSCQAQFAGVEDDTITLLKLEGVKIQVPREKLSIQDLLYLHHIKHLQYSQDHTDTESIEAEQGGTGASTLLQTPAFAYIRPDNPFGNGPWVLVEVLLKDGRTRHIRRSYDLFSGLKTAVCAEFSVSFSEGKFLPNSVIGSRGRTIHIKRDEVRVEDIIGPDTESWKSSREWNIFLELLLEDSGISESMLVKQFFAPGDFDMALDQNIQKTGLAQSAGAINVR